MNGQSNQVLQQPDWAEPPGAFLQATLDALGMGQSDLAERSRISPKHINQIIKQRLGISGEIAVKLEQVLGVSAQFWINATANYEAHRERLSRKPVLESFIPWADRFDQSALLRESVVATSDEPHVRVSKLLGFFRVIDPTTFDDIWLKPRVNFRRAQSFHVDEVNTALWLRILESRAENTDVPAFDRTALKRIAKQLPAMSTMPVDQGFRAARAALGQAGVVLAYVKQIPETRVCGATLWLGNTRAAIGLTERYYKLDTLWFNLMHEVGHLIYHPNRRTFVDLERDKSDTDDFETQADEFAAESLLPRESEEELLDIKDPTQLLLFAAAKQVSPAIAAGRLCHLRNEARVENAFGGWVAKMRTKLTEIDCETLDSISKEPLTAT